MRRLRNGFRNNYGIEAIAGDERAIADAGMGEIGRRDGRKRTGGGAHGGEEFEGQRVMKLAWYVSEDGNKLVYAKNPL